MFELFEYLHNLLAPYEVEAHIFAAAASIFRAFVELYKLKKSVNRK